MNVELSKGFTGEKVYEALCQIHPTKAPGPNGMPPLFYQNYWHVVGGPIANAVLNILCIGYFPHGNKHTHII